MTGAPAHWSRNPVTVDRDLLDRVGGDLVAAYVLADVLGRLDKHVPYVDAQAVTLTTGLTLAQVIYGMAAGEAAGVFNLEWRGRVIETMGWTVEEVL